jgi:hypothetical protein
MNVPVRIFVVLFFSISYHFVFSQCSDIQLNMLQVMQKADAFSKDLQIQKFGFDLRKEFTRDGIVIRQYSKCWTTNDGSQPVFEQLLLWDRTNNCISFLTLNMGQNKLLRDAVAERHPSEEQRDLVVGKMFRYQFSIQAMDGHDYYVLTVSFR